MYEHCTGKRRHCPAPGTRPDVLVNEFASELGELVIPEVVLNWLTDALNRRARIGTLPPSTNAVELARLTRPPAPHSMIRLSPNYANCWLWFAKTCRGRMLSCNQTSPDHSNW